MNRVYILSGARTPLGAFDGNLRDYREQRLGAEAMRLTLELAGFEAGGLSEIVVGTAKQTSHPSNLARYAMLEARFPYTIPAYTVQRQSASGLQAVANGAWSIKSGMADAILTGGCESMTHIPREIQGARYAFDEHTRIIFDPVAAQVAGAQPEDLTAEITDTQIADRHGISARELDILTADSAEKAAARTAADYICKMQLRKGKLSESVEADQINPANGCIAKPADGAAMLLLASGRAAKGKQILAELLAVSVSAGSATGDGFLGIQVAAKALQKAGAAWSDMARIEIVEMGAAQVLATVKKLGLEAATRRINPLGGGLATGNPWGASGTAHLVDLVHGLESGRIGMVINPAEGGQSICAIVKAM